MHRILRNQFLLEKVKLNYLRSQEKKGINFNQNYAYWKSKHPQLQQYCDSLVNYDIFYPSYFTSPIHTYPNGYLNWEHAFHSKSHIQGSALMCVNEITNDSSSNFSAIDAYSIYTHHIFHNILNHIQVNNPCLISDFGCGTCDLSFMLASYFSHCHYNAVDLSPYFLSIAAYNSYSLNLTNLHLLHSNIEFNQHNLPHNHDIIIINFVFHEMIPSAILNTIFNSFDLLKETGQIIIIDMMPEKLPPYPSFIDISEPHLEKYRFVNIQEFLSEAGFINISQHHLHGMSSLISAFKPSHNSSQ